MDLSFRKLGTLIVVVLISYILGRALGTLSLCPVIKKFKKGQYEALIPSARKRYDRLNENETFFSKRKGFIQTFDFFAKILAISHFALKDYEKFLFYNDSIKADMEGKHFWNVIYLLTASKDIPSAEKEFDELPESSASITPACYTLVKALFLFEKGQKEDAYPLFQEAQADIKMPALKDVVNEYLSVYSTETA